MPENRLSIISIKPISKPKHVKTVSISIDKIHEIIAEQDDKKAMDFLYELLDPYYPNCKNCGIVFFTENLSRKYCTDCYGAAMINARDKWESKNIEKIRKYKREWARRNKAKKEDL